MQSPTSLHRTTPFARYPVPRSPGQRLTPDEYGRRRLLLARQGGLFKGPMPTSNHGAAWREFSKNIAQRAQDHRFQNPREFMFASAKAGRPVFGPPAVDYSSDMGGRPAMNPSGPQMVDNGSVTPPLMPMRTPGIAPSLMPSLIGEGRIGPDVIGDESDLLQTLASLLAGLYSRGGGFHQLA